MAGWSMLAGESDFYDCAKTSQKLESVRFSVDFESNSEESSVIDHPLDKLRCLFDQLLSAFLKEIYERDTLLPLFPILGDGQCVYLFKLFIIVKEKGGYNELWRCGFWDLVADECGLVFDSASSSALKLVYTKYLDPLDRWLRGAFEESKDSRFGRDLMGLKAELKELLAEMSDQKKRNEMNWNLNNASDGEEVRSVVAEMGGVENYVGNEGKLDLTDKGTKNCDFDINMKCGDVMDFEWDSAAKEDSASRKRKRESMVEMLNWMIQIARNPCDPVIGSLPEKLKWKSYGSEQIWKRVLLVRKEMFLKRHVDYGDEPSSWQKSQKMHPSMYDDHLGTSYNLRERLASGKQLFSEKITTQTSLGSSYSTTQDNTPSPDLRKTTDSSSPDSDDYDPDRIPLGPTFQAEVPEWNDISLESDSKWLGTRIWPLEKPNKRFLIERDPIGKGRQESCGCQEPGSSYCARFHIAERRYKVNLELGTAFHQWKFDRMGDEVALSWTESEEKKFEEIVRLNPPSLEKCFWDQIFKYFKTKSRESLVSYYFNVFLLRRRGHQNRSTPAKIDSDDEEDLESGINTNGNGK